MAVRKIPGRDPLRVEVRGIATDPEKATFLYQHGLITDAEIAAALKTYGDSIDVFVEAARREAQIELARKEFGFGAVAFLSLMMRKRLAGGSTAVSIPDSIGRNVLELITEGSGLEPSSLIGFAGHEALRESSLIPPRPPSRFEGDPLGGAGMQPVGLEPTLPQTRYKWVHGLYRTPEQPDENHLDLDGKDFDSAEPVTVDGETFAPGDHPYCSCGWVPFSKLPT